MRLDQKHCVPCEGGVPALDDQAIARLLPQVPAWQAREGKPVEPPV